MGLHNVTPARTPPEALKARRKTVAARVIATGKPLARIAEDLNLSRKTISQDFNSPEGQDYLQAQLAKHDAKLDVLVDKSLAAIDEGLTALRDDAADHGARMRAVERTTKLLELRAGRSDGNASKPNLRWQGEFVELLAIYAKISTDTGEADA